MTTELERFLRCFILAKDLLEKYWMHTDGDYPDIGKIRVENVERAVEILTGTTISKEIVDFDGEHLRGVTEKYEGNIAKIYIRKAQPIEWQKYAAVKECSHILYDDPDEDYDADPVKILKFLTSNDPFQMDAGHSPAEISEKIVEVLALEIIYPIEWREEDRKFLEAGGAMADLVEKRHVPAIHIQRGCAESLISTSKAMWAAINQAHKEDI